MALVTFGLVSDVQYADIDNGTSFHGQMRYYRNALVLLRDVCLNIFIIHIHLCYFKGSTNLEFI